MIEQQQNLVAITQLDIETSLYVYQSNTPHIIYYSFKYPTLNYMQKHMNIMIACYSKYSKLGTFKLNRKQMTSKCCKLNAKTVVIKTMSPVYQSVHKKKIFVV